MENISYVIPALTLNDSNMMDLNYTSKIFLYTNGSQSSKAHEGYLQVKYISYSIVMPIILAFGIIGNSLNIIILCQQKLHQGMDKIERCAAMGFIFLAASDLLFCLVGFPSVFLKPRIMAYKSDLLEVIEFLYSLYRPAIMNVFLFSSTWCIVFIAVERYLVVTHPMRARSKIRLRRTAIFQISIPILAVIIHLPHFTRYTVLYTKTDNSTVILNPGYSSMAEMLFTSFTYRIVWNLLIGFLPMAILLYCNLCLLYAICRTQARGFLNDDKYSTSKITTILILIVTLYFLLIGPSVILNFLQEDFMEQEANDNYSHLIATVIANVLQSANFAINFLLYFGMHPKFREYLACKCCRCRERWRDHFHPLHKHEVIHLRIR